MIERLFTVAELAEYLQVKEATIFTWNSKGTGPKVTRVGKRGVRYTETDVKDWLKQAGRQQTA
jgi:excisionase family DNA binding protein